MLARSFSCACDSYIAGVKSDGTVKIRPIDDMSASGINDTAEVHEKLVYDTLDTFFECARQLAENTKVQSNCACGAVASHCASLCLSVRCRMIWAYTKRI